MRHVEKNPHTLLPRFMGAHRLIVPEIGKVHFVVFANVFSTDRTIHERYDLKGSTQGRTVGAEALRTKASCLPPPPPCTPRPSTPSPRRASVRC